MTLAQIIMLAATAFFAYKLFEYVQNLEEPPAKPGSDEEGHKNEAPAREELPPPPPASELVAQADELFKEGELREALVLLQEADQIEPGNPDTLGKLGYVLAREGELEEAVDAYDRALAIEEDDFTHNALGSVLRRLERYDEAKEHFERAIELDDGYEVTYFNYANLLVDMGENEKAVQMYEKALELQPGFEEAAEELSKIKGDA